MKLYMMNKLIFNFQKINTMHNSFDQLKIEYSVTDKESKSVRLMCIFLILIFILAPLTEIVSGFDYHSIDSYPTYFCVSDFSFEPLSFKEIK